MSLSLMIEVIMVQENTDTLLRTISVLITAIDALLASTGQEVRRAGWLDGMIVCSTVSDMVVLLSAG